MKSTLIVKVEANGMDSVRVFESAPPNSLADQCTGPWGHQELRLYYNGLKHEEISGPSPTNHNGIDRKLFLRAAIMPGLLNVSTRLAQTGLCGWPWCVD